MIRDDEILRARDALEAGGIVLMPTDTVYGLAVHPERADAKNRLFDIKRRPRSTNLPIMVAEVADIDQLGVVVTDQAKRLSDAFLPGPLTLALGVDPEAAPSWLAGRVEVAVRVPDDPWARALLAATGPLLVTSANVHTQPTAESVESILAELGFTPDAIIDGGVRQVTPSSLVNCNLPAPVVERVGAIPAEKIEGVLL